jgi:hypothetical protein
MEDDASQEEKQNYLRENILEKGYDANAFVAFLKTKKEKLIQILQIGLWKT